MDNIDYTQEMERRSEVARKFAELDYALYQLSSYYVGAGHMEEAARYRNVALTLTHLLRIFD